MSQPSDYKLPPPRDWQRFERWVRDIFSSEWGIQAKINGRSGQSQFGVDIYGQPKGSKEWHGIQCKKRARNKNGFARKDIKMLVGLAKKFKPPLTCYIIATTIPRDATIQADVREISDKNQREGSFEVDIMFWDDFIDMYDRHEDVWRKHYAPYPINDRVEIEKIDSDKETDINQIAKTILVISGVLHYGGLECTIGEIAKIMGVGKKNKNRHEFTQFEKALNLLETIGLIETDKNKLSIHDLQSEHAILRANSKEKLKAIHFVKFKIKISTEISIKSGFWVNWIDYKEAFDKIAEEFSSPDINEVVDVYSYRWHINDLSGAHSEAEKAAREALNLVNHNKHLKISKERERVLKYQLALSLHKQKKFDSAEKHYVELLKAPEGLPFPVFVNCLVYFGHILRKRKDYEKSFLAYEDALINIERELKQKSPGSDVFRFTESLLVEPLFALIFLFSEQNNELEAKRYSRRLKKLKSYMNREIYLDNCCLPPTLKLPVRLLE